MSLVLSGCGGRALTALVVDAPALSKRARGALAGALDAAAQRHGGLLLTAPVALGALFETAAGAALCLAEAWRAVAADRRQDSGAPPLRAALCTAEAPHGDAAPFARALLRQASSLLTADPGAPIVCSQTTAALLGTRDDLPLVVEADAGGQTTERRVFRVRLRAGIAAPGEDPAQAYTLLDPATQALLRALAVFIGRWDLAAAEQMADQPNALECLEELHGLGLVTLNEDDDGTWFSVPEPSRAWALAQLRPAGEDESVRERHYRCCLTAAEVAARDSADRRALQMWPDLRAALDWATARSGALALALAEAMYRCCERRKRWREVADALETVLVGRDWTPGERARLLAWLGAALRHGGDPSAARERLAEALVLWETADDTAGQAEALEELGALAWSRGDTAAAGDCFESALQWRRALGEPALLAGALDALAEVRVAQGAMSAALGLLREGLECRRRSGDERGVADTLARLGAVALAAGEAPTASEYLAESVAATRALGDRPAVAARLCQLATARLACDDPAEARRLYEEALTIRDGLGDVEGVAECFAALARIATQRQQPELARRYERRAVALREPSHASVEWRLTESPAPLS